MSLAISGTAITFPDASTQNTAATGFGFKNRIINGAMMIDQRNAGASVTPTTDAQYGSCDRWSYFLSQSSKFSVQQNAGAITPPAGYTNYLGVTSLSAYTPTGNDYFQIVQKIEGYNVADLAFGTASAATVTLSFWVRSSLTGDFGGALSNGAYDRSYPFTYTVNSANTWEQKTITIAGDVTGTWLTTNGQGLSVQFSIGAAGTRLGTAGAWTGSWKPSVTGSTNVVATNGATFYITGVQLEKGSTATSFDYRPYGTEFALCQRYYQTYSYVGVDGVGGADSIVSSSIWLSPQMRSGPTITYGAYVFRANTTATTPSTTTIAPTSSYILFQVQGTSSLTRTYIYNPVYLSAEL